MNILQQSLEAVDRLMECYSTDDLLSLLAKVKQTHQFGGPTVEEYFGVTGVTIFTHQDSRTNQPISPPYSTCGNQKFGLGFSGVFFFM